MKTTYEAVTDPTKTNAMEMTTQQWVLSHQGQNDESLEVARATKEAAESKFRTT